jgi:alcohol dehydrogenase class IV
MYSDLYELTLGHQVPTTAGTGSETTGTAILDITSKSFKTGIASRALKPTLGIVDTFNTESCPTAVHISAGLDVLFHSLESFTAIPFVLMSLLLLGFNSLAVDTRNAHQDPRIPSSDLRIRAAIL